MKQTTHFVQKAGVYGFDHLEPIILASLITQDPLLLIGKAGTGKTYLLNNLSEALGLNHKHYNASYLSFDDLIGFPYPSQDGKAITFIPTPATIWDAESILIDELSRCRPEVQNKFFSIVQEKRIQGIYLEKLRYCWAAMNPISNDITDEEEHYEGSISLDHALADRFAFIVDVPDWDQMSEESREQILHPAKKEGVSSLQVDLSVFITGLKKEFDLVIRYPPIEIIKYCQAITTLMTEAGYRISPRRARLMVRNFTALFLVMNEQGAGSSDKERSRIFKHGLTWSLPQRAYKKMNAGHVIDSAHQQAITIAFESRKDDRWMHEFRLSNSVARKIQMLINSNVTIEHKSIATMHFLHHGGIKDKAIFAFTAQPYLKQTRVLNEEAMNELSVIAAKLFNIHGTLEWTTHKNVNDTNHPKWSTCARFLAKMSDTVPQRKKRIKQLFLYLVLNNEDIEDPGLIEEELNDCFTKIQSYAREVAA